MDMIESAEMATTSLVKAVLHETSPKFDEIINIDIKYTVDGTWHQVEMTWKGWLNLLQTGEFEGNKITSCSIFESQVELADGATEKIRMIYDFVLLNTNRNPWRLA